MNAAARGLLDTSVFIARESRDLDLDGLPDEVAVSVITHAELSAGVLAAKDVETRARRLVTLTAVADLHPLPIDTSVAEAWAKIRVQLALAKRRANVNDMWIAATALSLDVPVVTQDADFDVMAELTGLAVVRV
ncbi:type II toxin-antitoxin system VapC family toxin [Nocardioides sp. BGMRC 2183]|nr:type II toxin-antitoxin system VapC family toxin [Nocardioides sp. BGMRC 2183]